MTRNHRIRFMDNQSLTEDFVTAGRITYSSQLSDFPFLNALNPIRSKVWRPAGNFEVTTSNLNIYINDGSDKTVALTVGAYTYATLAAHVQTRLNALSTNWTCTYDYIGGSFRFTITRTVGTGTLRFTQTTNAAWDMLGFTKTTDLTDSSFPADQQRNHTSEWVKIDLVQSSEILFAGAVGPIAEKFSVSNMGTLRIRGNDIDLWDSPPLSVNMDISDLGALKFLDDIDDTIYRYYKIELIDRLNPIGPDAFSFGYFYLGDYRTPLASNIGQAFTKRLVDQSVIQRSQSGVAYASRRPKFRQFDALKLENLPATSREYLEQVYYDLGLDSSFFVSLDPTLLVSSELDEMTFLANFTEDPVLEHIKTTYYRHSLSLREAV